MSFSFLKVDPPFYAIHHKTKGLEISKRSQKMQKYIEGFLLHLINERWDGGQTDLKLMMDFLLRVKLVDFMFKRFRMRVEEEEKKKDRESGKMFFVVLEEFIIEGRIK